MPPRIVMLGTGDFALPTFLHLVETGHDVAALVTQPDRPQGRKQELIPSAIIWLSGVSPTVSIGPPTPSTLSATRCATQRET